MSIAKVLAALAFTACSARDGPEAPLESVELGEVDEYGYAIIGDDLHPPLLARVEARACPASSEGSTCASDEDCAGTEACLCGRSSWIPNT